MDKIFEVHKWPNDMAYPYGEACGGCKSIGTIESGICSSCGYSYKTVRCERCGTSYGENWDQSGKGCPACAGIVSYPIEFYKTDEYKKEQMQKSKNERLEAVNAILANRFNDIEAIEDDEIIGIAIDCYKHGWLDQMAQEWMMELLKIVFSYKPHLYDRMLKHD